MFSVVLVQGTSLRHLDKRDQCQFSTDPASPPRSAPEFSLLILVRATRGVTNTQHPSLAWKLKSYLEKQRKLLRQKNGILNSKFKNNPCRGRREPPPAFRTATWPPPGSRGLPAPPRELSRPTPVRTTRWRPPLADPFPKPEGGAAAVKQRPFPDTQLSQTGEWLWRGAGGGGGRGPALVARGGGGASGGSSASCCPGKALPAGGRRPTWIPTGSSRR